MAEIPGVLEFVRKYFVPDVNSRSWSYIQPLKHLGDHYGGIELEMIDANNLSPNHTYDDRCDAIAFYTSGMSMKKISTFSMGVWGILDNATETSIRDTLFQVLADRPDGVRVRMIKSNAIMIINPDTMAYQIPPTVLHGQAKFSGNHPRVSKTETGAYMYLRELDDFGELAPPSKSELARSVPGAIFATSKNNDIVECEYIEVRITVIYGDEPLNWSTGLSLVEGEGKSCCFTEPNYTQQYPLNCVGQNIYETKCPVGEYTLIYKKSKDEIHCMPITINERDNGLVNTECSPADGMKIEDCHECFEDDEIERTFE